MICFFLLFIALQSQNTHSTLVKNRPHLPTRYAASRGTQPQKTTAINCDVKSHLADFAIAVQIAIRSLTEEIYLDQHVPAIKLPASIESISILDAKGKVKDSTIIEFIGKTYALRSSGETKEGEYYIPLKTTMGTEWILIKTKAE